MSQELMAKARHAFEDRLQQFLVLLSVLSEREMDLVEGRLSDMIAHENSPLIEVRANALRAYRELRRTGVRRERRFKRIFYTPYGYAPPRSKEINENPSMYCVRCAANFPILWDGCVSIPGIKSGESIESLVKIYSS